MSKSYDRKENEAMDSHEYFPLEGEGEFGIYNYEEDNSKPFQYLSLKVIVTDI